MDGEREEGRAGHDRGRKEGREYKNGTWEKWQREQKGKEKGMEIGINVRKKKRGIEMEGKIKESES